MKKRKYGEVYWLLEDFINLANMLEIDINSSQAKVILIKEERRMTDAMSEIGWAILQDALQKYNAGH